jgi:hypothetical protein
MSRDTNRRQRDEQAPQLAIELHDGIIQPGRRTARIAHGAHLPRCGRGCKRPAGGTQSASSSTPATRPETRGWGRVGRRRGPCHHRGRPAHPAGPLLSPWSTPRAARRGRPRSPPARHLKVCRRTCNNAPPKLKGAASRTESFPRDTAGISSQRRVRGSSSQNCGGELRNARPPAASVVQAGVTGAGPLGAPAHGRAELAADA